MRRFAFAPVVDDCARVLILGSLPGEISLKTAQYYAHPQNAFWRLIEATAGLQLAHLPYPERLEGLKTAGIGLWDVIASAERQGSLDAAIRDPDHAELQQLIGDMPALRAVGFNGGTAARIGRRILARSPITAALVDLPSSSAAHARPFEEKRQRWAALAPYLR